MEDKEFEGKIKKYNSQLSKKITALENYKENVNYRKEEVEELEKKVKEQQEKVEKLDEIAILAGSMRDLSFSDKMIENKDILRELNSRLEKRRIIQSEIEKRSEDLTNFTDNVIEEKNSVKEKITEISEETSKKAKQIKQHKEEIDKLTDEIILCDNEDEKKEKQESIKEKTDSLNKLISSKKQKDSERKVLIENLGSINEVIKKAQAYINEGIVPREISERDTQQQPVQQ